MTELEREAQGIVDSCYHTNDDVTGGYDRGALITAILAYGREREAAAIKLAAEQVPTSWLDSLLTGPDAVISKGYRYNCTDIERLLKAVKMRIESAAKENCDGKS